MVIGRIGGIDRSPCGAGAGDLAINDWAAGRLAVGSPLPGAGIIDTRYTARVAEVGGEGAIAEISGSAWITGTHQFTLQIPLRSPRASTSVCSSVNMARLGRAQVRLGAGRKADAASGLIAPCR